MSEGELLKRIDAHLARIEAHLARIDAHLARIDAHLARIGAHLERNSALMDEIREEIRLTREAAARHAEMYERLAAESDRRAAVFEDTRAFTTALISRFDRWMRDLMRDQQERREESRANTQALLAILDRLEPGGATG